VAHEVFDKLWRNNPDRVCYRTEAYLMLAEEMGYDSKEECHIALMCKDEARRVPAVVKEIRRRLDSQ